MASERAAPRQVSLLRGINVGGRTIIAMSRLRTLYEALGCRDVDTHLQSGNVILRDARSPDAVSRAAAAAIRAELGLDVRVLGRTHEQLVRILATDAFPGADPNDRHVVFLSGTLKADAKRLLAEAESGREKAAVAGHEIHLLLPDGVGRAKLSQALIERRLGVTATTRNWRTVTRLEELSQAG
jgi:uncharacterized protein (DUF1697 family)